MTFRSLLGAVPRMVLLPCLLLVATAATAATTTVRVGGSGTQLGAMRLLADAYTARYPHTRIEVLPSIGSGGGIAATAAGELDLGLSSRALKPREQLLPVTVVRYAQTPLVFVVSLSRPETDISSRAVADIYRGKLNRWTDGTPVRAVLRPRTDSDSLELERKLPGFAEVLDLAHARRGVPIATTDQDNVELLQTTPGAIGSSTLAQILTERLALRALALDGVAPNVDNLAAGAYPLAKTLYCVLPAEPSPATRAFVDFIRSSTGRKLLAENGHWVVD